MVTTSGVGNVKVVVISFVVSYDIDKRLIYIVKLIVLYGRNY